MKFTIGGYFLVKGTMMFEMTRDFVESQQQKFRKQITRICIYANKIFEALMHCSGEMIFDLFNHIKNKTTLMPKQNMAHGCI